MSTPPTLWHRDHWSTLAYAFTCLGRGGVLDNRRLRLDGDTYPTKLRDGTTLPGHTDLDCLQDAEDVGILRNILSGFHPVVRFTPEGLKLGQWLCLQMELKSIRTADLTWDQALTGSGAWL